MKPSNILYCLLAVCLLSGFPARGQTQPIESKYYYSSPQLGTHYETDTATMEEFVYYTVAGLDLTSQPGAPTLPVKYVRFSVPYNAANITVNASRDYTSLSRYGLRVYPVPQPIPTDGSVQGELPMVIDSTIYNTDAYWPASVAELVSDGFYLGDNRVITVAVYPIQYNPMNTFLRFNTEIELTISYTIGATPGNILVRQNLSLRQDAQDEIKELVENPGQVEAFAMAEQQAQLEGLIESGNGEEPGGDSPHSCTAETRYKNRAQYLIITTDSLAPAFERLAALKRQMGLTVQIKTVSEILADSISQAGDVFLHSWNYHTLQWQRDTIYDAPAKIRKFLRYYYKYENTDFVLFGGLNVPYRMVYEDTLSTVPIPSDVYYSDLTTLWRLKPTSGKIYFENLCPDIYVGRLLCTTQEQVNNYINKLLRYTLNPGNGDLSYLTRSSFYEGFDLLNETEDIRLSINNIGLSDTLLYEHANQRIPNARNVIQDWNSQKNGFIGLFNHADHKQLTIYGYSHHLGDSAHHWIYDSPLSRLWALDSQIPQRYDSIDTSLEQMRNKYHPSIMYSIGCNQIPYEQDWTFGTSFTLGKDFGGPAFLGNTREGYHGKNALSNLLCKLFLNAISDGHTKIGIAETYSKINYNKSRKTYFVSVHNLLGDPEFEMWTGIPSQYSGISINRQNTSISVSGIDTSTGETIVAVCGNDSTIRKVTTTDGTALFTSINPNSTIMLYRHNYLPWIAPLALQNERVTDDRYIIASDVTAGREVDSNRTAGDFVIAEGTTYEIEHKGTVSLQPGFKVEKGASFSVKLSDY